MMMRQLIFIDIIDREKIKPEYEKIRSLESSWQRKSSIDKNIL